MAQRVAALPIIIEAVDLASVKLSRIEAQINKLAATTDRSGKAVAAGGDRMAKTGGRGAVVFTNALTGVGLAAAAAAFQSGRFNLNVRQAGVLSRSTGSEWDKLRATALTAGRGISVLPTQAAATAQELARLGLSTGEIVNALVPTLKLMTASLQQLGPASAGKAIAQSLILFNLEADQASRVAAVLAAAGAGTAIEFNKLALGIAITQTGASRLNASFEETVAVTSLIANLFPQRINRGVRAAARLFEDLADVEKRRRFEQVFGVRVTNAQGDGFQDLSVIIRDFVKRLQAMNPVQRQAAIRMANLSIEAERALLDFTTLSERGIKDFNRALVSGESTFGSFAERLRNEGRTGSTLDKMSDTLAKSLPGAAKDAAGAFQELGIVVGTEVERVLIPSLSVLARVVRGLAEGLAALPESARRVGGTLATLALLFFGGRLAKRAAGFLFRSPTAAGIGGAASGAFVARGSGRAARVAAAEAGAVGAAAGKQAASRTGILARFGGKLRFLKGLGVFLAVEELLNLATGNKTLFESLAENIGVVPSGAERRQAEIGQFEQFVNRTGITPQFDPRATPQGGPQTGSSGSIAPRTVPPAGGAVDAVAARMSAVMGDTLSAGQVAAARGAGGGEVILQPVEITLDMERVGKAVLRWQSDRSVRRFERLKTL